MINKNPSLLFEMLLKFPRLDNVFNPYTDYDAVYDAHEISPAIRFEQFKSYINGRLNKARVILVGDSLSSDDAKFSGIPLTDEAVLLGRKIIAPFEPHAIIDVDAQRTSSPVVRYINAQSGSSVSGLLYSYLYSNNIDPRTVVTWNAFPFHTHKPGDSLSNRSVRTHEVEAAYHIHNEFFNVFRGCRVLAIGQEAKELMDDQFIDCESVPNPAINGARSFTESLKKIIHLNEIVVDVNRASN